MKSLLMITMFLSVGVCVSGCERHDREEKTVLPPQTSADAFTLQKITGKGIHELAKVAPRRPTLVNVWASWCEPCREEFPQLLKVYRDWKARGLQLILVSADFQKDEPAAVDFLKSQGVDFVSYIKDGDDQAFIDELDPHWTGALPTTFLMGPAGQILKRWDGKIKKNDVELSLKRFRNAND